MFDLGAAECVQTEAAHTGPIWSLAALPDRTGFVSASADKQVRVCVCLLAWMQPQVHMRACVRVCVCACVHVCYNFSSG